MRARAGASRGGTIPGGTVRGGSFRGRGQSNDGNNPATATGRRPTRVIQVPLDCQRETTWRERKRLTDVWKEETGCEVNACAYDDNFRKDIITRFEIFGSGPSLDKVVSRVESWIRYSVEKTPGSTAWAKIRAHVAKDWFKDYAQREQDERKQKFKGVMPQGEESNYKNIVTFDWPQNLRDANVLPKDAFGTSLEKLESIRMDDEVFIKAVGLNQLEIRGSDINRVKLAEQHVKVLCEKVHTMMNTVVFPVYILLDRREGSTDGVIYERADAWWPGWPNEMSHPIAPRLKRCVIMSSPGEYWQDLQPEDRYDVQCEIKRALDAARYEKGYYDLSIRLGCVALKMDISKVGKTIQAEAFMSEIIQTKDLDCVVKNWLFNDEAGEEMLARLMKADHLLEPTNPTGFGFGYAPDTLAESWVPTLRGSWVFRDPNSSNPKSPCYVVQVHWTTDEDGLYEKDYTRFYLLEPERIMPKENMDVKLLELGESKGWQFSLTSMTPVSRALVPTALLKFADHTHVKPKYETASKEIFATFPTKPLKIVAGRLDKVYTFGIKKTGYRVDAVSMWYPGKSNPCWSLNVYHSGWGRSLAELERLRPGDVAHWGDTVSEAAHEKRRIHSHGAAVMQAWP